MSQAKSLISLTFDDGLDSHLDKAIPLMERFGLKGTFYVPVGDQTFANRYPDWRIAAKAGHELGNHSVFHPAVSSKSWVTDGRALEKYTLDRMDKELRAANTVLQMLDGRTERTYAFPCSNPWLGDYGWPRRALAAAGLDKTRLAGWVDLWGWDVGATRVDYTPVVEPLFFAARCGGVPEERLPVRPPQRFGVKGVEGDGRSLSDLKSAVAIAIERKAWLSLVFHGIGGGHHMSCDEDVFEALCQHLASTPGVEVVTFLEGAKRTWARA